MERVVEVVTMDHWRRLFASALKEDLEARRKLNPRYSIRAYAKHLGISAAAASEIFRSVDGWKISRKRAFEILKKTKMNSVHRSKILVAMGYPAEVERRNLPSEDFELFTDWSYFAVYFSHSLPVAYRNPSHISERFGLSEDRVNQVINDLIEKKLLKYNDEEKALQNQNENWIAAGGSLPKEAVRSYHKSNLDLAKRAMGEIDPNLREISSMTFCGSLEDFEKVRKETMQFYERIMALMNKEEKNDEVIQVNVSLFPLHFGKGLES